MVFVIIVVAVGFVLLIRSLNPSPGTKGSSSDDSMIYTADTSAPAHHHSDHCGHSHDGGGDSGGDSGGDGGGGDGGGGSD